MTKNERQNILKFIKETNSNAFGVLINPNELIFEENVKMNCYYCGKYSNNWRCPPNIPTIDYKKMMSEFDCGMFVVLKYDYNTKEEFDSIRTNSSVTLHKLLLTGEKWLYNNNSSTAISFTGGSCKLCKGGCGKDRCNNPYMSRTPLEATGVNIIKSASKYGINIKFPTENSLMRLGLLLWQED